MYQPQYIETDQRGRRERLRRLNGFALGLLIGGFLLVMQFLGSWLTGGQ